MEISHWLINSSFWTTRKGNRSPWAMSTVLGVALFVSGLCAANDSAIEPDGRSVAMLLAVIGALIAAFVLWLYFYTRR